MKKVTYSMLIVMSLFISSHSSAQIAGNVVEGNNLFNNGQLATNGNVNLGLTQQSSSFSSLLEASVMVNVKAESYVAIFSLTQHGKTIEEAESGMRARSEIFRTNLQQEGMDVKQIFFDPITMIPTYETEVTEKKLSRTFNEVPTGFEMKRNVHITFYKQEQISPIISMAARAEVYDLVKVDYNINNKDALISMLRQDALKILLEKQAVLEKAGIHTRFTQVGEMHNSAYPLERYQQYYAYKTGAAPSFVNNVKNKPIQVQYNYAEKNKTVYYEKVSDRQFDKVINPVVNEPMVQVYLSLKGEFRIYDPETEKIQKDYDAKVRSFQLRQMELDLEGKKKDIDLKGRTAAVKKTSPKVNITNVVD